MGKDKHLVATVYLRITAGVTALIAVALLLSPDAIMQWFTPDAQDNFFIRFIGSALLGYSTLNLLASRSKDMKVYRIAIDANLVALSVATVLSTIGVTNGAVEEFGWLLIAEHAVFLLFFIWARFTIKPAQ